MARLGATVVGTGPPRMFTAEEPEDFDDDAAVARKRGTEDVAALVAA